MTPHQRLELASRAMDFAVFAGVDREREVALQAEYFAAWAAVIAQSQEMPAEAVGS